MLENHMLSIKEIESLGFTHIIARWFKNHNDTIRIRQWYNHQIIIYKWRSIEESSYDNDEIVFNGRLDNVEEIKWILDRINTD